MTENEKPQRSYGVTQLERWLLIGICVAIFVSMIAIAASNEARTAADEAKAAANRAERTAQRAIDETLQNRQSGHKSRALSCTILDHMVQDPPLLELCGEPEVVELRKHVIP